MSEPQTAAAAFITQTHVFYCGNPKTFHTSLLEWSGVGASLSAISDIMTLDVNVSTLNVTL